MEDEQQMLIDIEQNIANLEKSLGQTNSSKRRGSWQHEKPHKKNFVQRGLSLSMGENSPDKKR